MSNKLFASLLRTFADNIDSGNTNATEEELIDLCDQLAFIMNPEEKLSKYQSAKILGMSIKTFDYHVAKGNLPKPRSQQGFKEVFWYRRDIINFKKERDEGKS